MILSNTSHCFHSVVLTGSRGHPEHKLSNPSMASWLLLRGGYQSQWVCCFSIFPVWLYGIKGKGFLVSSGVILLNPGTVCQEQRARCQHSCIRAVFSVRGQTVMWLPLKVTAGIFGHIFGWSKLLFQTLCWALKHWKWVRPCPYLWRVPRDNEKTQKQKSLLHHCFLRYIQKAK